jgi:ribosomal protein L11 methyltransferase
MAWLQVGVASQHPEFAEEILLAHGAQAVSFIDAQDEPVLEPLPGTTPLWPRTLTLGLFPEQQDLSALEPALRELLPDGPRVELTRELIEDQDWVRVWLEHWQPLRFGRRLWITPHEKRGTIHDPDAVIVTLDPGLAFGTGTHATTALCLEWLEAQDLRGLSVLDYGCGSGILAVAALVLGARSAVCVDIDPQALQATRENALANGVAERIETCLPEDFEPFAADRVVANILAGPLIALAPRLAHCLRPGGRLALSGLLQRQAEEVRAAYLQWFDCDADGEREGWTRISARLRG